MGPAISGPFSARIRLPAMPELPEVETVRRGLEPHLRGRRIARVTVRDARLRWAAHITAIIPPFQARKVIRHAI